MKEKALCQGKSCELLKVGQKVRIQLDNPTSGKRLHGKFRSDDIRYENKIRTITQIYLNPGKPPLYQVDNDSNVAYTKHQLQVVSDKEKKPSTKAQKRFYMTDILGKVKRKGKVFYRVEW